MLWFILLVALIAIFGLGSLLKAAFVTLIGRGSSAAARPRRAIGRAAAISSGEVVRRPQAAPSGGGCHQQRPSCP
ncbi:MAG: hypothetical protein M3295_06145 [Chloroflexota bacterium]|nr:hypothetical protein [Chloroflexota bacterium]